MSRKKKPRGDEARAARLTQKNKELGGLAREAAEAALQGESRRRTLMRVIASLVEQRGGVVRIPFRIIAGAPDVDMVIENQGSPDAVMVFTTGKRDPHDEIIVSDRVVVHSWSNRFDKETPSHTGLSMPGRVSQLDGGELLVVELDQENALHLERVIVPKAWVTI